MKKPIKQTNKQKSLQKTNARRKSYQEYHNQIAKEIKGKSYKQPENKIHCVQMSKVRNINIFLTRNHANQKTMNRLLQSLKENGLLRAVGVWLPSIDTDDWPSTCRDKRGLWCGWALYERARGHRDGDGCGRRPGVSSPASPHPQAVASSCGPRHAWSTRGPRHS